MKRSNLLPLLLAFCINASFAQSVGTTEGVFNVSDMGAANYSIPIKVPDGINGMQPSLALVYNSQGGNGPLGMGWSVSGLSAITRTGNTIYHDSKVNGISLTNSDKFALDGNRLMVTSGTYGTSASKYRTEVETFKDITANGTLGSGPQSFTVTDQNGWTYEYGNTTDSRQIPVGKTEAVTWYLNKVKDLQGNYITYEYINADGDVLPKYVKYNCNQNTGLTFQSYISFSYANKPDPNIAYIAGGSIKNTKRINKISVTQKVNSLWYSYRSYIPEYADDFYTHLTKVTEKGADGAETFNPMEFTYGSITSTISSVSSGIQLADGYKFSTGDYNGDGYTDVVNFSTENQGAYNVMINNKNGGFTTISTSVFENGFPNSKGTDLTKEGNHTGIVNFDYNGDGKSDFARYQNIMSQVYNTSCGAISYENWKRYWVYLSNGTSLNNIGAIVNPGASNNTNNPDGPYKFLFTTPFSGDFDGDGRSEILLLDNHEYGYGCYNTYQNFLIGEKYCTPSANITNALEPKKLGNVGFDLHLDFTPSTSASHSKTFVVDYNGDGKNEIMRVVNGTTSIWELNVSFDANGKPVIGNPVFIQVPNTFGYPSAWHHIFTGDFNGDRKTDVLTFYKDNSTPGIWEIGYGKGNGTFDIKTGPSLLYEPVQSDTDMYRPVLIADYNGDGLDDVFMGEYPINATSSSQAKIFFSNGNNMFSNETVSSINTSSTWNRYISFYWPGDFNGDGSADFLWKNYNDNNSNIYISNFHPNETRHLLSKVKDGLGAETGVNYLPLTNSNVYSSGSNNYTYPYIKRTVPFKVVSGTINDNVVNSTGNTTTYTYRGLRFHAQGKGIMGFENVRAFNAASRMVSEKNFLLNATYAFPYLEAVYGKYVKPNNTEELLNMTTNSYGVYHYGSKRIFPYQVTSYQYNALTAEAVQVTNNYVFPSGPYALAGVTYSHNIGKPFSITTNKGYGLEITTQAFTYPNSSTFTTSGTTYTPVWVYSRPSKVVTTNTRQGQPAYSRTATFTYNTTTGLLDNTVSDPGTSNESVSGVYYDSYGNPSIKYTAAPGLPSKSESRLYDPSHRYVTESYSLAFPNIKNKATYDGLTGKKLTETAPDGFTTTYTYDAFGRLKTTSDNNGFSTTTTYNWGYSLPGDNVSYYGAAYYVNTTSNTGAVSNTLYDWLGREMKTKFKNFQGQWVSTRKEYNIKGQVASTTKPYFDNTSPQHINYSYDAYGRPTQVAAPEGNTTYTYGLPNSTGVVSSTTNAAGQTTSVKTDASGVKISTTDAANNILSYTYHSTGNVKSVTGAGTTLQTYTYDAYNNLVERSDPNYGTYKYTYDAYGQMLKQTDPKNRTYTFKYDALGRIEEKTGGPEGDYFYQYNNNAGTNCGKLTLLSGPEGKINYINGLGGKIDAIGYDDNGWASQITGSALSGTQVKTFTYDNFGRIQKEGHWPSNTTLWYEYGGANGELTQITNHNNSTVLYEKTAENAAGQTTAYRQVYPLSGYELKTYDEYNAYSLLSGQLTTDNNMPVRELNYNFDPSTGNLLNRRDNIRGLEETFSYDNQNRLIGVSNINNPALDIGMQFSLNGNIEKKTDAGGSFEYDQANRVSAINLSTELPQNIPHATQELSYTPFDKVATIDENGYHTEFRYWPDGSRNMMVTTTSAGDQKYKLYIPGMETSYEPGTGQKNTHTYVESPDGNVVGIITYDYVSEHDYFVLTDHLGSFTHIIDEQGNIVEEKSFDAWGRLRNPQTWEPYASNIDAGQPQQLFDRGYTGHEHLPYYGIINMNGRLYDPVMGRMFSPDVNIVGGGSLQGYNRYTYALNNPLVYTDPSGDNPLLIASAIGAGINAIAYTIRVGFSDGSFNNWSWRAFGDNVAMGATSGALTFGVGSIFGPVGTQLGGSVLLNEAARAGAHGTTSYLLSGGQPSAFAAGAFGSLAGSAGAGIGGVLNTDVGGTLFAAGVGGVASEIGGGSFIQGAAIAGIGHLANQTLHNILTRQLQKVFDNYPTDGNNEISNNEAFARVSPAALKAYRDGNACATRLSLAFAKAGVKLPAGYGGIKDTRGNRIITSAAQMQRFLANRYGFLMTNYNETTSKNGIYIGLTYPGKGYSGHVTIIRPGFNSQTYEQSMRAMYFWPLK